MPARFRSHFGGGRAMLTPTWSRRRASSAIGARKLERGSEATRSRHRHWSEESTLRERGAIARHIPLVPAIRYTGARFGLSGPQGRRGFAEGRWLHWELKMGGWKGGRGVLRKELCGCGMRGRGTEAGADGGSHWRAITAKREEQIECETFLCGRTIQLPPMISVS